MPDPRRTAHRALVHSGGGSGIVPPRMGESPKITDPLAALEHARVQFEQADDFPVAVEGGFAILDPATLEMTAGFERFDVAAREHPSLREMVAGELIRSEVEVRTGKCGSFAEAAAAKAQRRGGPVAG